MTPTRFLTTYSLTPKIKARIKKKLQDELMKAALREELLIEIKRDIALESIERKTNLLEKKYRIRPEGDYEDEANAIDRDVKAYCKDDLLTEEEAQYYIARLKCINT